MAAVCFRLRGAVAWTMLWLSLLVTEARHLGVLEAPSSDKYGGTALQRQLMELEGASVRSSAEEAFGIMVATGLNYCTGAAVDEEKLDELVGKISRNELQLGYEMLMKNQSGASSDTDDDLIELLLTVKISLPKVFPLFIADGVSSFISCT